VELSRIPTGKAGSYQKQQEIEAQLDDTEGRIARLKRLMKQNHIL
jgi:hypothetical protein